LHCTQGRVSARLTAVHPFGLPSAFRATASHRLVRVTNS
jgi:hypothetical protein